MKKTNALYCITAGNPKKLIKPVVWTVLADLVNLFPFCLLATLDKGKHDKQQQNGLSTLPKTPPGCKKGGVFA